MGMQVCNGALMQCTMGVAPCALIVLPQDMVTTSNMPAATIMDYKPIVNVPTFGMCNSMANPVVAAATAAKLGVFTPMPCVPNTVAPWVPGAPTVLIGNKPALNNSSKLMCLWAGVISINVPGQFQTMIP